MEELIPEGSAQEQRDCRRPLTIPFCVERRGKRICPYFVPSDDDRNPPETCLHLDVAQVLDKNSYDVDVDGEVAIRVRLRACRRRDERVEGEHAFYADFLTKEYRKLQSQRERESFSMMNVVFGELSEAGKYEATRLIRLLSEVPRFRKPEPETQPAPLAVRLPLKKEDK